MLDRARKVCCCLCKKNINSLAFTVLTLKMAAIKWVQRHVKVGSEFTSWPAIVRMWNWATISKRSRSFFEFSDLTKASELEVVKLRKSFGCLAILIQEFGRTQSKYVIVKYRQSKWKNTNATFNLRRLWVADSVEKPRICAHELNSFFV